MNNESTYDEFSTIENLAKEVTESFQREGWNTVNNAATTGSPESDLEELGMASFEGQNGTVQVQRKGNSDEVTVKYQPDGDVSNPRAIDLMLSRKNDSEFYDVGERHHSSETVGNSGVSFSTVEDFDSDEVVPDVSESGYEWEVQSEEGAAMVVESLQSLDQSYSQPNTS